MRNTIRHAATAAAEPCCLRPGFEVVGQQQLLAASAAAKVDDAAVVDTPHIIQAHLDATYTHIEAEDGTVSEIMLLGCEGQLLLICRTS